MSVIDDIDDIKTAYLAGHITRDEGVQQILGHPETEMSTESARHILDQPGSYKDAAMGALQNIHFSGALRK